jgi:hypothetical protein
MAGDVRCDVCGRTFQHEASGPTVRCPYCQMTVKLPTEAADGGSSPGAAPQARASAAGDWRVYTCDGQRYGPITKDELDRWAAEKRLTASCQVYQDGWPTWRTAPELYPSLPPATAGVMAASAAAPNVGPGLGGASSNRYAAPAFSGGGGAAAYQLPHRGVLILLFGILGWAVFGAVCGVLAVALPSSLLYGVFGEVFSILGFAVCGVFALTACIMGYADLQKMKAGEMDNSGHGMTMAGIVLGIFQCVPLAVLIVIAIVVIWITAAAGNAGNRF